MFNLGRPQLATVLKNFTGLIKDLEDIVEHRENENVLHDKAIQELNKAIVETGDAMAVNIADIAKANSIKKKLEALIS